MDIVGAYTLTLTVAVSNMPSAGDGLAPIHFQIAHPARPWARLVGLAILILGSLVAGGMYALIYQPRERSAPIGGQLHLIQTPPGEQPGQRWYLDPLRKNRITIGGPGCNIPLKNSDQVPPQTAEIVGRRNGNRHVEILFRSLGPDGLCRVNGQAIRHEQPLWDRDKIQIGDYTLRYENLNRRRPTQRSSGTRKRRHYL